MRFDKPVLTLKEFAKECGFHVDTVRKKIIEKGKVKYKQNGVGGHIRIDRDRADEFHNSNTFGGQAYGK